MLTSAELDQMASVRESAFLDRCVILSYSVGATNRLNEAAPVYTPGDEIPCGYTAHPGRDQLAAGDKPGTDATFRLPLSCAGTLKSTDRIRLVQAKGRILDTPLEFAVVGAPQAGHTALTATAKSLTAESSVH